MSDRTAALDEIESRLERVWNLMEPSVWTKDPDLRRLGGPVEAICQDIYFALETARAALARVAEEDDA